MDKDRQQLQRNRGRVAILAFGIMMLGATTPELGDLFDDDGPHDRMHLEHRIEDRIDVRAQHEEEQAAEMTERAAEMAERAAEMADRATRMAAEAADRAERFR